MTMANLHTIHVIDDEPVIHDVLGQLLTSEGYEVTFSSTGEEALEKYAAGAWDVILLDLLMPGLDGIEVLKAIKKIDPLAVIIIITAYASVESAISAMKFGAYDYIQKPFKHEDLLLTIQRAIEHKSLRDENIRLKDELTRKFGFGNIIGRSLPMSRVFDMIKATAPTRSTVLIQGESGTGKELVARAIHLNSDRKNFSFVVVNSGSLPPDLLESHLFGHVRGAFTGAVSEKRGLFEAADRGSIFFDEISTLSLETQAKLLRVMQDKEFMRLGGTKTLKVDARIIAATNIGLEELIERQAFRQDLFYRLNVIKIELPPLRERLEDIPALVHHFIDVFSRENAKEIEGLSEDVMELLENHDWPGNVRELENVIERAVVLTKTKLITRGALPPALIGGRPGAADQRARSGQVLPFKEQTRAFQKKVILEALRRAKGVQKNAAESLGLKPTTLNEILKRLRIGPDGTD
jgi:two-component system response regulator PilR (NtrC family)